MLVVNTRKLGVRSKRFLFSKMVQGYGNVSADLCLILPAVGHSLSMWILQALWEWPYHSLPGSPFYYKTVYSVHADSFSFWECFSAAWTLSTAIDIRSIKPSTPVSDSTLVPLVGELVQIKANRRYQLGLKTLAHAWPLLKNWKSLSLLLKSGYLKFVEK